MSIHFITSPKHSPTRGIKQWWVIRHHCWGYPTGWRIQPVGGSNQGNWENRGAASPWSMGIGRKRTWEWGFSRAWGGGVMGKSPKCTPWITIVVPLMIHYEIWESTCSYPRSLPNVDAEANVASLSDPISCMCRHIDQTFIDIETKTQTTSRCKSILYTIYIETYINIHRKCPKWNSCIVLPLWRVSVNHYSTSIWG